MILYLTAADQIYVVTDSQDEAHGIPLKDFLKQERQAQGLSLSGITRAEGCERSNAYYVESGRVRPTLYTAIPMLSYLGYELQIVKKK